MKKVSLLLILCLTTAFSGFAQESGVSAQAGRNTTFKNNSFWSNWFVGAGAGANIYFGGDYNQEADYQNRFTVAPSIFVGKWFSPYMGARLRVQGGKLHTFSHDAVEMQSQVYGNAHVDIMWNVTNYLGRYNQNRFYNFIPTVGLGFIHRDGADGKFFKFDNGQMSGPTLNAGLLNTFRLSNRLSAFVEFNAALTEGRFDILRSRMDKQQVGANVTATGGLMLNVGKVGFEEAILMDRNLVDGLNSEINKLRATNAELSRRPAFCPDCPPAPKCPTIVEAETKMVPNVVFFRLGSAVIDNNQEINVYNTAEYLKANPEAKVKIVGYADKKTGTENFNMKLSEKRAKIVADALIKKHNVSSDRVSVEWKGASEQPYKENSWNRVAIFFAE